MPVFVEMKDGKVTNVVYRDIGAHAYDDWIMESNHRRRVALIRMGWAPEKVLEVVPMFHGEGRRR